MPRPQLPLGAMISPSSCRKHSKSMQSQFLPIQNYAPAIVRDAFTQHFLHDGQPSSQEQLPPVPSTLRPSSAIMAPYIQDAPIEPVDEALETPLKAKPQLVAPEPGTSTSSSTSCLRFITAFTLTLDTDYATQNTVPALNPNKQAKATPAPAVPTNKSAPLPPKDPTQTSPS